MLFEEAIVQADADLFQVSTSKGSASTATNKQKKSSKETMSNWLLQRSQLYLKL